MFVVTCSHLPINSVSRSLKYLDTMAPCMFNSCKTLWTLPTLFHGVHVLGSLPYLEIPPSLIYKATIVLILAGIVWVSYIQLEWSATLFFFFWFHFQPEKIHLLCLSISIHRQLSLHKTVDWYFCNNRNLTIVSFCIVAVSWIVAPHWCIVYYAIVLFFN